MLSIAFIADHKDHSGRGGCLYSTSLMLGFIDLGYTIDWYGGKRELWWKLSKAKTSFCNHNSVTDWAKLEQYDYILIDGGGFIGDNDPVTQAYFAKIGEEIHDRNLSSKTVILDFRDHSGRGYDPVEFAPIPRIVIARRETSLSEFPDLFPLDGHGYQEEWNKKIEKDIFVSCLFGHVTGNHRYGWDTRPRIAEAIANTYPGAPVILGDDNRIKYDQYMSLLNRSIISITCWGGGYNCYRDWEILSCGAILAYKKMPNPHLDPYLDMISAIVYDEAEDLLDKLEYLSTNQDKIIDMALRSLSISEKKCRPRHKAQALIDEIQCKKNILV